MNIQFKKLQESHFPLLLKWLLSDHIHKWWDPEINWTLEKVKEEYKNYANGFDVVDGVKKPLFAYIIVIDGVEIGYIQHYNFRDFPIPKVINIDELPDTIAGLDLFIGEKNYTKKGLGRVILQYYLYNHIDPTFDGSILDPELHNIRAVKAYSNSRYEFLAKDEKHQYLYRENPIRIIDEADSFKKNYLQLSGAIVVNNKGKILLQKRDYDAYTFPSYVCAFGGKVENGESPLQAIIRELDEELGAKIIESEIIKLESITEILTNHSDVLHMYFWHDKNNTITGCYEGQVVAFDNMVDVLMYTDKLTDEVLWSLRECYRRNLL